MKDILIIGAGPAGLTAAHELLSRSKEFRVHIVEESGSLGGISRTVQHNGNRMDIGGHRFFSRDPAILAWWAKRLPLQGKPAIDDRILGRKARLESGGPDPETEDDVMLVRHRISRIYFAGHFFDYPLKIRPATFFSMGLSRTLRAGFSYLSSCIWKRKEASLEDFYINRFGSVLYSMFFESYTEKVWGVHPRNISADWGAQRVKGLSIRTLLTDAIASLFGLKKSQKGETSLIEEFWYPKLGPGQLWEKVAEEVCAMGGEVHRNSRVSKIVHDGRKITRIVCRGKEDETVFFPDYVFSSMPVRDLVNAFDTRAPEEIIRIADGLPYRDFITVGLLVKRLLLKNTTTIRTLGDIVPDCWIYIQEPNVRVGRLQIFNNWSPYLVEDPATHIWLGMEYFCSEDDELWRMESENMIRFAISEMSQLGILSESDVLDAHVEKVKKAYPAYFGTYGEIKKVQDYLNSFSNLFCIGRNGQHRYNNMDHSMLTSIKSVEMLLTDTVKKEEIWNINSEKEYHESK